MNMTDFNRQVIEEFRATGGRVSGRFERTRLLLLTTMGAKSGRPHTTPLMYTPDGGRLIVFASKRGAPAHPDWYHNLVAHPSVTVEVGAETFTATATVATGEERRRLWDEAVAQHPFLAEHQASTTRQIPVVILHRATG